ncbi:MAG: hypothetical protein AMXMBFR83_31730 [Phycisphaerae bacterium]
MTARRRPPIDLARVRAAEERLAARLAANPALAERTAAMLTGELPCPDLDEEEVRPMQTEALRNANVRLSDDALARAVALVPKVAVRSELAAAGRVTRSDVLRLAVLRGLDALEAEYAGHPALPGVE